MESFRIREITQDDLKSISAIHLSALPDDLLPQLGAGFLEMLYYQSTFESPYATVLVAEKDNKIVGFVNIAYDPVRNSYWIFRRKAMAIAARMLLKSILRPAWGIAMFMSLNKNVSVDVPDHSAEISFIAVSPEYHGKGIGKQLAHECNKVVAKKGCTHVYTKTLLSNVHVQQIYIKAFDARIISTVTIGRKPFVYVLWDI